MVMVACATVGKTVVQWMQDKWNALHGTDISAKG
jgi:hypothetical protein